MSKNTAPTRPGTATAPARPAAPASAPVAVKAPSAPPVSHPELPAVAAAVPAAPTIIPAVPAAPAVKKVSKFAPPAPIAPEALQTIVRAGGVIDASVLGEAGAEHLGTLTSVSERMSEPRELTPDEVTEGKKKAEPTLTQYAHFRHTEAGPFTVVLSAPLANTLRGYFGIQESAPDNAETYNDALRANPTLPPTIYFRGLGKLTSGQRARNGIEISVVKSA